MLCPVLLKARLQEDRLVRHAEGESVLPVVDGLTTRKAGRGGGAVATREDEGGEEPGSVQLGGRGCHAEVVTAEPDRHVHAAEVRDASGGSPRSAGRSPTARPSRPAECPSVPSLASLPGQCRPRLVAPPLVACLLLMFSMLRRWWLRPCSTAAFAALSRASSPSSRVSGSDSRM